MYHVAKNMIDLHRPLPECIFEVKDKTKECLFHRFHGHSTGYCLQLKDILERMAREGKLTENIRPDFYKKYAKKYNGEKEYKKKTQYRKDYTGPRYPEQKPQDNRKEESGPSARQKSIDINVISGGHVEVTPDRCNRDDIKPYPTILHIDHVPEKKRPRSEEIISFSEKDFGDVIWPHDDPIVLKFKIEGHRVQRILVDTGSSADVLYLSAFKKMGLQFNKPQQTTTPLTGFTGDTLQPRGVVRLKVTFGTLPCSVDLVVDFLVVNAPSAYNAILGRGTLNKIGAVISSPHLKIKFSTAHGVGEKRGQQQVARECYQISVQKWGG